MSKEKKKRASRAIPPHPHMEVTWFRGELMLAMPTAVGPRATTRLRAEDFPLGALVFLREGHTSALPDEWVEVTLVEQPNLNRGQPFQVFRGTSQRFVRPERDLLDLYGRDEPYVRARTIDPTVTLRPYDRLSFDLTSKVEPANVPPERRNWTVARWFEHATYRSPKAAYEARSAELADALIVRLFAEDDAPLGRKRTTILSRAHKAYGRDTRRRSWSNRLRRALELIESSRLAPTHPMFTDP